jgi:hypothetical protein
MATLSNIQTKFSIPTSFNEEQLSLAAKMIVDKIQENTSQGKDRHGNSFKSYSKSYKDSLDFKNAGKTNLVNLELTGDMMASLEVISIQSGVITIGYKSSSPDAGKVEGNQVDHKRPFIGLPQNDLDLIIATVNSGSDYIAKKNDVVNNLLKKFLGF